MGTGRSRWAAGYVKMTPDERKTQRENNNDKIQDKHAEALLGRKEAYHTTPSYLPADKGAASTAPRTTLPPTGSSLLGAAPASRGRTLISPPSQGG